MRTFAISKLWTKPKWTRPKDMDFLEKNFPIEELDTWHFTDYSWLEALVSQLKL